MNLKVEYVLSEYYKYYNIIKNSYPHTISEKMGGTCEKVSEHSLCCSLKKSSFLYLGQIIDVIDDSEFGYLLCKEDKLAGNKAIRAGSKVHPSGILANQSMCIMLVILAMFTKQFKKKTIILNSFVNFLKNKNFEDDSFMKEFLKNYINDGELITCCTEIGIMIKQIFEICTVIQNSKDDLNLYELESFVNKRLKNIIKQSENINEYQDCFLT